MTRAQESERHRPNTAKRITILYANARSIIQKHNHLVLHAVTENPDVIMITESWPNTRDKHQLAEISIDGYNLFAKCRFHMNGGGVLIYARNNMNVAQIKKQMR